MNAIERSNPAGPRTAGPREPFADDPAQFLEWAARGAGHDLSNQLLAIQWCGSLLDEGSGEPATVRELAQEIAEAVGRARGTLGFLASLVQPVPHPLEVRELLGQAMSLIRQALGSKTGAELDVAGCVPCRLAVDPRAFVQVLTKLARHLVRNRPGGVLKIKLDTLRVAGRGPDPFRLIVSLQHWLAGQAQPEDRSREPDRCPDAADAELAEIAAYLEHRLGGELVWQTLDDPVRCELCLMVAADEMPLQGRLDTRPAGGGVVGPRAGVAGAGLRDGGEWPPERRREEDR